MKRKFSGDYHPGQYDMMASSNSQPPKKHTPPHLNSEFHNPHLQRNSHVPAPLLNSVAESCILKLSENKEHVSLEKIELALLNHFRVNQLADIGVYNITSIKCVYDLCRTENKVNINIQSFIKARTVCTLYELNLVLCDVFKEVHKPGAEQNQKTNPSFDDLKLGPLTCMPAIIQYFQVKPGSQIYEITTLEILEYLQRYLTDQKKWNDRVDLAEFMKFICKDVTNVDDPLVLGIRINSLGLAIQAVKKAARDKRNLMLENIESYKNTVHQTLEMAFNNFRDSLLIKNDNAPPTFAIRNEFIGQPAKNVLKDFLSKIHYLLVKLESVEMENCVHGRDLGEFHKNKLSKDLSKLMNILFKNELTCTIVKIAICCSQDFLANEIREIFSGATKNDENTKSKKEKMSKDITTEILSYEQLEQRVLKSLSSSFKSQSDVTLRTLSEIEESLLKEMDVDHFGAFKSEYKCTTFLQFLLNSAVILKKLEKIGGITLGSSSSSSSSSVTRDELTEFIRQCFSFGAKKEVVKQALCHLYNVYDLEDIPFQGNLNQLIKSVSKSFKRNKDGNSSSFNILHEHAVCAQNLNHVGSSSGGSKVGSLGSMRKEDALVCMHTCPLLHDIQQWTHWDELFLPQFGTLKKFLQENGGRQRVAAMPANDRAAVAGKPCAAIGGGDINVVEYHQTDIVAMETKSGRLIKLTSQTDLNAFEDGVKNLDPFLTSGHLVSKMVAEGNLEYFSYQLFGNQLKRTLIEKFGSCQSREVQYTVCQFVMRCITCLPSILAATASSKVFLEPLNELIGSTKSKELIWKAASDEKDYEKLNKLECIGIRLGIPDWYKHFLEMKLTIGVRNSGMVRNTDVSAADNDQLSSKLTVDGETIETTEEADNNEECTGGKRDMINTNQNAREDSGRCLMSQGMCSDGPGDSAASMSPTNADHESITEENLNYHDATYWRGMVDEIRRNEFGIGVALDGEGRVLMKKQLDRQGRCLDRLSKDLYSKDTHFVLELVQNADDNSYSSENCTPSLRFILNQDSIVVLNNEVGFSELNFRAICDVGRTTKGKHMLGYIGQKGIGFKSVFRVSDTPEVHSRGLHVKFDANSKPLGYILPEWTGDGVNDRDEENRRYTTRIVLPLRDETAKESNLSCSFQDMHPSLLLFLHRLKNITIVDKVSGEERSMSRRDLGSNLIEIEHNGMIRTWIVFKKVFDSHEIPREAKAGGECLSTELALAFPVEDMQFKTPAAKHLLFAFLPLRSYGFRFIIHGDFDVPSSREDVVDTLWNQWLRSNVHILFLEALEHFKNKQNPAEEVCKLLKFLPRSDEILDFFRPVSLNIINSLKHFPCLLSADDEWCLPSDLVLCDDPLTQTFVTSDLLTFQTGLHYLHPTIASLIDRSMLLELGVQLISTKHLLAVGRQLIKNIQNQSFSEDRVSDDSIGCITTWLICLYNTMHNVTRESNYLFGGSDDMNMLMKLSFIPLTDGSFVSVQGMEETIFFPLLHDDENAGKKDRGRKKQDHFYNEKRDLMSVLEKDVNTVDRRLLLTLALDGINKSKVTCLLEKIGIKRLNESDLIKHHIIPSISNSEKLKGKSDEVLIIYARFLKDHYKVNPSLMAHISTHLPIATNKGMKLASKCGIHFSSDYNNEIRLKELMPCYDWILLDNCYLNNNKSSSNTNEWREFFKCLGVVDFLWIEKEENIYDLSSFMTSKWQNHSTCWPPGEKSIKLIDYKCNEFDRIVEACTNNGNNKQQLKTMFELVNKFWEMTAEDHSLKYYTACTLTKSRADCLVSANKVDSVDEENDGDDSLLSRPGNATLELEHHIPSTFGMKLQHLEWLPVFKPTLSQVITHANFINKNLNKLNHRKPATLLSKINNSTLFCNVIPKEVTILKRPNSNVVALTFEAFVYVGHHGHYIWLKESDLNRSLAEYLGIQMAVDAQFIKRQLISWCTQGDHFKNLDGSSSCNKYDNDMQILLNSPTTSSLLFNDSITRISEVYRYLEENLVKNELASMADSYKIIFLENLSKFENVSSHDAPSNDSFGKFVGREEACWTDETGLLKKYFDSNVAEECYDVEATYRSDSVSPSTIPRVLNNSYPLEMEDFFLKICKVNYMPNNLVYEKILNHITSSTVPNKNTLKDVLTIFNLFGEKEFVPKDSLKRNEKIFPSKLGHWVGLLNNPVIADDRHLEQIFSAKDIHFVDLDEKNNFQNNRLNLRQPHQQGVEPFCQTSQQRNNPMSHENIVHFLQNAGLPLLSNLVKSDITTEMFCLSKYIFDYFNSLLPCIQRFLFNEFPDIYKSLCEEVDIAHVIQKMKFAEVHRLEFVHTIELPGKSTITSVINKICQVQDDFMCVCRGHLNFYADINRELAYYFSRRSHANKSQSDCCFKEMRGFLMEVTALMENGRQDYLESMMMDRSLSDLPDSEKRWSVNIPSSDETVHFPTEANISPSKQQLEDTQISTNASYNREQQGECVVRCWPPKIFPGENLHPPFAVSKFHDCLPNTLHNNLRPLIELSDERSKAVSLSIPVFNFRDLPIPANPDVPCASVEEIDFPAASNVDMEIVKCDSSRNDESDVGSWGELYVLRYLQHFKSTENGEVIKEIIHMNADAATTAPFDIEVKLNSGESIYIEIKTSSSLNKNWFETSLQELSFALNKGESYQVYQVKGVKEDPSNIKITKIVNLKEILLNKKAKLAVIV